MNRQTLSNILIPALVFQSVVIAGGYATGRELVEFFLTIGPWAGLVALFMAAVVWSIVCAVTFEFARRFHAYDYRDFFFHLLGKGWVLFEICYLLLAFILLGVVASSAGSILVETLHIPYQVGVVGISAYICFMVWRGSRLIERALSFWSIMLYVVFAFFLLACVHRFGANIADTFAKEPMQGAWWQQGIAYAGYNLGFMPAVLFSVRHCKTQAQAISSGVIAGIVTILPGVAFFIAMCGFYPQIINQTVPSTFILKVINILPLTLAFHFVVLGTITESGTSVIHAINQRLASAWEQRGKIFPRGMRPLVAFICLTLTYGLSQFGLESLVSKGYGTITWAMILIYVIPVMTVGIKMIVQQKQIVVPTFTQTPTPEV